MPEPRTITVAIDPELHADQPENEAERIVWEALDTAWNLLRETAVRVTILELREQLAEAGFTNMRSDEELFAEATQPGADPDMAKSYLDLAPDSKLAAVGLSGVFEILVDQARIEASEGMGDTLDEVFGE